MERMNRDDFIRFMMKKAPADEEERRKFEKGAEIVYDRFVRFDRDTTHIITYRKTYCMGFEAGKVG